MTEPRTMRERLDNGGIVLATHGNYLVAAWCGQFVLWMRDAVDSSSVHSGVYFDRMQDAGRALEAAS